MNRTTISLIELFDRFPDQDAARSYMEAMRWPGGPACPHCQEAKRIHNRKGGYYRCNACREDFTVRTGTVMERSHIPLQKWLYGMYLLVTSRKGISSVELHTKLAISQKSAWFMLHRLREACRDKDSPLSGIVEIDETYVGGKQRNEAAEKEAAEKAGK
jgi:transposase-like protein